MKTLYLIGWWLLLAAVGAPPARAQSCDETVALPEAAKRYANGNFDDVFALLGPCVKGGFSTTGQVQAYRLMALSYLALDSLGPSQRAIGRLLALSPQAEPDYADPPRYKALFQYVRSTQEQVTQVTSVSKRAENILFAPATVAVVTSRDFQQRGYQTLEQALHDLAGFDVIKGNGVVYSLFYQRGYRSDNNDRTLILIDGVEDNDLVSNQVVMSPQYALSDIDRIEVIYGPASTLYGANAFTGVINIITKSFRTQPGPARMLGLTAQTRAGTYNTQYLDGTLSARTSDVALTITARGYRSANRDLSQYPEWNYSARTAADYTGLLDLTGTAAQTYLAANALPASPYYTVVRAGANSSVTLTPQGAAEAARKDNYLFGNSVKGNPVGFGDNKYDWYVRGKLEFKDLTISYFDWRTSEAIAPWYTNRTVVPAGDNPRWITHDRAFSLTYTRQFSDKFSILNLSSYLLHEIDGETALVSYRGYYNRTLNFADLVRDTARARALTTYQYRLSTQFRNELRLFYSPLTNLDLNGGLEARSGLIQGNYITSITGFADETGAVATGTSVPGGNNFRTLDLGVYAQANYRPIADLKLVAAARLDHNQVRDNGGYGTVVNPRVAAIYRWGDFVFKAIYAEAFKDASFLQKYGTTTTRKVANPTLQPERVRNYEGSIYYQFTKALSASLVAYHSNYNNSVGLDTVRYTDGTLTQQFQPVGSRRIWGLQAEGNLHLLHFNLWWNATYTHPVDAVTGLRISDIANYMANAGADWQVGRFSLYASGNLVGARRSGAGTSGGSNNPITHFDPYLVLNANLSYHDLLPGLTLQASVSNLLDTEYFVPGVRAADVYAFASRLPQDRRFLSVGAYYILPTPSISR